MVPGGLALPIRVSYIDPLLLEIESTHVGVDTMVVVGRVLEGRVSRRLVVA